MKFKPKEKAQTICVRVKESQAKKLEELAEAYQCSKAQIMRHGFDLAIKELENKIS